MRLVTQIASAACACAVAAGCGGSPTAPSSTVATDAVETAATPQPFPPPVSQTLTGSWYVGDRRFMTVTENGTSVTGMTAPVSFDAGGGVIVSDSGIISGAVDGDHIVLTLTDHISLSGTAAGAACTAERTFSGTLTGSTLSGTMTAWTMPLTCGPGVEMPAFELPDASGPVIYTRQ